MKLELPPSVNQYEINRLKFHVPFIKHVLYVLNIFGLSKDNETK